MQLLELCLSVSRNVLNAAFELVNQGRSFLRRMRALLNDGLDKVLCRMWKSLIFATFATITLSIIFEKESFINGNVSLTLRTAKKNNNNNNNNNNKKIKNIEI